jgi:hypothetical protein
LFSLKRNKKTIFTVAIATALCLVLSGFLPITRSQTSSNFTVPWTINTIGSAWDGELAFDLAGTSYSLVVASTNGTVQNLLQYNSGYGAAYNIAPDTILFQGQPQVDGANTAPTYATHIWNFSSDTIEDFPNVISHHDIQYDPSNNTFLTLQNYVWNNSVLIDKIVQVDPNGNVLWSWDTNNYIPLSEASTFNETSIINGQTVEDFTHCNSLDWQYNDSVIYLNVRNINTFYKINQTTGKLIWACGEFGNFTLLGTNGQPVPSLWYHCHDVKEVAPDVFTLFDNDYNNNTNPNDCHSRMVELTLNETSMTAYVNWSWEAPTAYWNSYAGATLILPNGDYLGDFGDPTHQFPQNAPYNFNNTGAVLVEVNPAGQIVRTFTFPVGWYIYHIEAITNPSVILPTQTPAPTQSPSNIIGGIIGGIISGGGSSNSYTNPTPTPQTQLQLLSLPQLQRLSLPRLQVHFR